ncbi:hypothetical protein LP420_36875 [Massilia sp. B-10]|nr:hypothetical protein LP420_36875 [Massilia sp. B-10]
MAPAQLLAQDEACRLIEVGCGTHEDFGAAHIPGACWLDTASLETPPLYNKVSDDALLALMLGLGVDATTTVILYGRSTLAAARAHLMLYAGVGDVRLLDGGFDAWRAAGLPCESGAGAQPAPCPCFGAAFPGLPDLLLDTAASAALLGTRRHGAGQHPHLGRIHGRHLGLLLHRHARRNPRRAGAGPTARAMSTA